MEQIRFQIMRILFTDYIHTIIKYCLSIVRIISTSNLTNYIIVKTNLNN